MGEALFDKGFLILRLFDGDLLKELLSSRDAYYHSITMHCIEMFMDTI